MNLARKVLAATALVLGGCADPMVRYEFIDASTASFRRGVPDLQGRPKFKLSSSIIRLNAEKGEGRHVLKITSMPVEEAGNVVFSIEETSAPGLKTNLKIKNRDNSMLVESVITALEDNRVKLIQGVGGVLAGVLGGVAKAKDASAPPNFSAAIDLRRYFKDKAPSDGELVLTDEQLKDYKSQSPDTYKIESLLLGPVPADATARKTFPFGSSQRTFIFSACRSATLRISINNADFSATVKVADPNFIQTVGLPQKGSVTMHSECGVSVTSEPVQTASPIDLIQEFMKQLKAVFGD